MQDREIEREKEREDEKERDRDTCTCIIQQTKHITVGELSKDCHTEKSFLHLKSLCVCVCMNACVNLCIRKQV